MFVLCRKACEVLKALRIRGPSYQTAYIFYPVYCTRDEMSSEYFPPIRAGLAAVAGTMAYNFDGALSASIVRHQRPWRPPSNDNTSDSIPT